MSDNGSKRYYWLKLSEDFFRQKEIKKLRRIAGGDTYTVIYLKMLLRSMEDGGKLYYEGYESDFASELALDIDEDVENVKMTVAFLIANGILHENTASEYEITTAKEMVGSEGSSARRMRKMRAVKAIAESEKRMLSQSDSDVTECDTDIEIDTDKEIDQEIYKESEEESACACEEVNPYGEDRPRLNTDTIQAYAANNLTVLSPRAMEELNGFVDDLSEEIVRHGIDNALDQGVRTWAYVKSILNDYVTDGVKSVAEAKACDEKHRKKRRGGGRSGPGFDRSTSEGYVPLGANDRML